MFVSSSLSLKGHTDIIFIVSNVFRCPVHQIMTRITPLPTAVFFTFTAGGVQYALHRLPHTILNDILSSGFLMANSINMLLDVNVPIGVQLGQTRMTIRELLNLKKGGIVRLNRMAGEAVDVFISKKLVAKGEITVVDDRLSVRIVQIYGEREKFKHL